MTKQISFSNETPVKSQTFRDFKNYDLFIDDEKFIRIHEDDLKRMIDTSLSLFSICENLIAWSMVKKIKRNDNKIYYDKEMKEEIPIDEYEKFLTSFKWRVSNKLYDRIEKIIRRSNIHQTEERINKTIHRIYEKIKEKLLNAPLV